MFQSVVVQRADTAADRLATRNDGSKAIPLYAGGSDLYVELKRLVQLLEPLEQDGRLQVPGLATLNGARRALAEAEKLNQLQ